MNPWKKEIGMSAEDGQDTDEETNQTRKIIIIRYTWKNML